MRDKIYNIYVILCCSWAVAMVFAELFKALPNLLMIGFILTSFFVKRKKPVLKDWLWYGVFIVSMLIASLINNTLLEDFKFTKYFFILPLVVIAAEPLLSKSLSAVKKSFVGACVLMALISGSVIVYKYMTVDGFSFENGEIVHTLLLGERIYIGFYMGIAAFIAASFTRFNKDLKWERWVYIAALIIIILFIILISSRIGFICLLILVAVETYKLLRSKRLKWYVIPIGITVVFTLIYNTSLYDRIAYRTQYNETFVTSFLEYEARSEIWPCAVNSINTDNIWFGNAYQDSQDLLVTCYKGIEKESKREWFLDRKFNSHNQFINILMGSGVLTLLLFSAFLLKIAWRQRNNLNSLGLLACLLVFFLIENVLYRQSGLYIVVLIFSILQYSYLNNQKSPEIKK